jgi:hypothetical protein
VSDLNSTPPLVETFFKANSFSWHPAEWQCTKPLQKGKKKLKKIIYSVLAGP